MTTITDFFFSGFSNYVGSRWQPSQTSSSRAFPIIWVPDDNHHRLLLLGLFQLSGFPMTTITDFLFSGFSTYLDSRWRQSQTSSSRAFPLIWIPDDNHHRLLLLGLFQLSGFPMTTITDFLFSGFSTYLDSRWRQSQTSSSRAFHIIWVPDDNNHRLILLGLFQLSGFQMITITDFFLSGFSHYLGSRWQPSQTSSSRVFSNYLDSRW